MGDAGGYGVLDAPIRPVVREREGGVFPPLVVGFAERRAAVRADGFSARAVDVERGRGVGVLGGEAHGDGRAGFQRPRAARGRDGRGLGLRSRCGRAGGELTRDLRFGLGHAGGDAVQVLRYEAGLASFDSKQKVAADVTGEGDIDIGDAVRILRYEAGLVSTIR